MNSDIDLRLWKNAHFFDNLEKSVLGRKYTFRKYMDYHDSIIFVFDQLKNNRPI